MINDIKSRLHELGCSEHYSGFDYAAELIRIVAETNIENTSMITLYRDAANGSKTSSQVERCIRTLVESAANIANEAYIEKFASMLSPNRAQPTNTMFIFSIADEFRKAKTDTLEADQDEEKATEPESQRADNCPRAYISEKVAKLLEADNAKIDGLISKYPVNIPVSAVSEFIGCDIASTRAIIENGVIGLAWRKHGCANHGYYIPTAQFVRWYLKI